MEPRESRILAGVMGDGTLFSLLRWLMSASGALGSLPGAALALPGVLLAPFARALPAARGPACGADPRVTGMGAAPPVPLAPSFVPCSSGGV